MPTRIAFVTYETPYAPCGGIAAVMGRLPGHIKSASGLDTLVITPFHHRIAKTASLETTHEDSVSVPLGNRTVRVNLLRYEGHWPVYFLEATERILFAGERHPYDVGAGPDTLGAILLRDSLFFGSAVAKTLERLGPEDEWILMVQDWEAATAILALASSKIRCRPFITLHNSYDSGWLGDEILAAVGIDPAYCRGPGGSTHATVLERSLSLTSGPVFTVSEQFALDLLEDTFQAKIMAPHLQHMIAGRLQGVDNGPFAELALDGQLMSEASHGNFRPLVEWKQVKRAEALEALDKHVPSRAQPVWGDFSKFRRNDAPWFVVAGRDDSRQKGYDIAAVAIGRFLEEGGDARFFLFPIPGDEGLLGLEFIKELAERFPGSVVALPFIFQAGYFAALQGASFGMMPSLYEPFGMANEFYLKGTVGIGRATGGIIQQIVPLQSSIAFTDTVRLRAEKWYGASSKATGILFRERDDIATAESDWRAINEAHYDTSGGYPNRMEQRNRMHLFQSMADELRRAIISGARIFREEPELYYRMLFQGIEHIQRTFSWERAASEYLRAMG